jgi:hypothetical protein
MHASDHGDPPEDEAYGKGQQGFPVVCGFRARSGRSQREQHDDLTPFVPWFHPISIEGIQ